MPKVLVHRIGEEHEPVAVIEDFAPQPDLLRQDALTRSFTAGERHYPGVKAAVPDDYLSRQWPVLAPILKQVFGACGRVAVLETSYALVTTAPDLLTLEQRLPHVDALEPGQLALIHYLVPGGSGGTAFYRHRSTGFETVDRARSAEYFQRLNHDLRQHGQPQPEYLNGSTPIFEQIGRFDGQYNRALVYRGRMLHSGAIDAGQRLSADPSAGRLTVTGFFKAD